MIVLVTIREDILYVVSLSETCSLNACISVTGRKYIKNTSAGPHE